MQLIWTPSISELSSLYNDLLFCHLQVLLQLSLVVIVFLNLIVHLLFVRLPQRCHLVLPFPVGTVHFSLIEKWKIRRYK